MNANDMQMYLEHASTVKCDVLFDVQAFFAR